MVLHLLHMSGRIVRFLRITAPGCGRDLHMAGLAILYLLRDLFDQGTRVRTLLISGQENPDLRIASPVLLFLLQE